MKNTNPQSPKPLSETLATIAEAGETQCAPKNAETAQPQPMETPAPSSSHSANASGKSAGSSIPNRAIFVPNLGEAETILPPSTVTPAAKQAGRETLLAEQRYEVINEFAKGGLGRISQAIDHRLARPVALKEILRRGSREIEERFLREAYITAKLEHPSIIPIHDLGRWQNGAPYYSMKLILGQSLDKVLAQKKTLSERLSLLPNVIDACDAIAYAHSQRIIHRDLKPHNILVGAFGETVVIDWGIAKELGAEKQHEAKGDETELREALESEANTLDPDAEGPYRDKAEVETEGGLTKTGAILGTPAYMPLEQAQGKVVDERADVYSLGAILYNVLSGSHPYTGKKSVAVLKNLLSEAPIPLEEKEPNVPKDLLAIVHKAMARMPEGRYPTAKELSEDLKKFQTGKVVGAYQYTSLELVKRFLQKNKAAVSMAAAGLVALSLFGVWDYQRVKEQRDKVLIEQQNTAKERDRAEQAQKVAEDSEKRETERSNRLTLERAKLELQQDPRQALATLKELTPTYLTAHWSQARIIAQEAVSMGLPVELGASWDPTFAGAPEQGPATSISFSSDNKTLAVSSKDGSIRLWDVTTNQSRILTGHEKEVLYVLFSPDGKTLASISFDNTVRLWDAETGALRYTLSGHTDLPTYLVFSPDGERLASFGRDATIRIWEVSTGALSQLLEGHEAWVRIAAFSPDGETLASGSQDQTIRLWDLSSGKSRILRGHNSAVRAVIFSLDGSQIFSAAQAVNDNVRIWDTRSSKEIASLPVAGAAFADALKLSPDGKRLAFSNTEATSLWDVAQCRKGPCQAQYLRGHASSVIANEFSPDGSLLVSVGADATTRLWDVQTLTPPNYQGQVLRGHSTGVRWARFSSDGKRLSTLGSDGVVYLWDLSALRGESFFFSGLGDAKAVISPDMKNVALYIENDVYLWDLETNKKTKIATNETALSAISFSPDKEILAFAGGDKAVQLWSLREGKITQTLSDHKDAISAITFSFDGKLLISASYDNTVKVWDTKEGQVIRTFESLDVINGLAVSPDGKVLAAAGGDKFVYLWDLATGKELHTPLPAPDHCVPVVFSPDGATLAVGLQSGQILLWELARLKEDSKPNQIFAGHSDLVSTLHFSPDGGTLASTSVDKTARLWDVHSSESLVVKGFERVVTSAQFFPDGRRMVLTNEDRAWIVSNDLPSSADAFTRWLAAFPTPPKDEGAVQQ